MAKWVRDSYGNIGERINDHEAKKTDGTTFKIYFFGIYKIKDTPQELIQEEDLVETTKCKTPSYVYCVDKEGIWSNATIFDRTYNIKKDGEITKILTPKGKDYVCQWEANDETN